MENTNELSSVIGAFARASAMARPKLKIQGFSSLHPIMRMRGWIDRRLARRTTVNIPAIVRYGEIEFSATIKDISSTGVGLELAETLPIRTVVEVSVGDFVSLLGIVRWSKDGSAGVELMSVN